MHILQHHTPHNDFHKCVFTTKQYNKIYSKITISFIIYFFHNDHHHTANAQYMKQCSQYVYGVLCMSRQGLKYLVWWSMVGIYNSCDGWWKTDQIVVYLLIMAQVCQMCINVVCYLWNGLYPLFCAPVYYNATKYVLVVWFVDKQREFDCHLYISNFSRMAPISTYFYYFGQQLTISSWISF